MPIYRGSQKITPRRGGQALSRVYRGGNLVWQDVPPLPPWPGASGSFGASTPARGTVTLATHTIGTGAASNAAYSLTVRWTSNNGVFNQIWAERNGIVLGDRTISGAATQTFTATGPTQEGDVITFRALASSYTASERRITSGSWAITP